MNKICALSIYLCIIYIEYMGVCCLQREMVYNFFVRVQLYHLQEWEYHKLNDVELKKIVLTF
jgi:hypothetical protein